MELMGMQALRAWLRYGRAWWYVQYRTISAYPGDNLSFYHLKQTELHFRITLHEILTTNLFFNLYASWIDLIFVKELTPVINDWQVPRLYSLTSICLLNSPLVYLWADSMFILYRPPKSRVQCITAYMWEAQETTMCWKLVNSFFNLISRILFGAIGYTVSHTLWGS